MKTTILTAAMLLLFTCTRAQMAGSKIAGPITILDTLQVRAGDTLYLGTGSDPRSGNFVFLYQPPNVLLGVEQQYLWNSMAGTRLIIKHFRTWETKRMGKKTIAVVNPGALNFVVELEAAIRAGEIVSINSVDVRPKAKPEVTTIINQGSLAEEIAKLKTMLKDSIINEQEYNELKAKLLDK